MDFCQKHDFSWSYYGPGDGCPMCELAKARKQWRDTILKLTAAIDRAEAAEEACKEWKALQKIRDQQIAKLREELEEMRSHIGYAKLDANRRKWKLRAETAEVREAKLRAVVGDLLKCDAWCPWCGVVVEYGEDNHQSWCKRQQALSALEGE